MKTLKINFKKIFIFLFFLFLYMIPYIFIKVDKSFYNSLNKINIPPFVFIIIWSFLYILLSFFWANNFKTVFQEKKRLLIYLIINYLSNFMFMVFMFKLHFLFWAFVSCIFSFLSILLSYMETVLFNKKGSYLFIPNIIWSLIGTILSVYIFLNN